MAKAAKLRAERENNAFGRTHSDFLDRLTAAEKRDQEQQQQQQASDPVSESEGPKVKVKRKSPIRSAGKRLKKFVASSGGRPTSPLKKKRAAVSSAVEQAALAKVAAEKAAQEKRRREAKPSAADPARELAHHGYEALGPIAAGAFSTILRARPVGAEDASLTVAVKTFDNAKCAKNKESGEARDCELAALRLLGEAGARHPHIAYMLSEHEGPNTTHAVLEYCPGGSLQRHMQLLQKQKAPARGAAAHSAAGSSGEGVGMPEDQVAWLSWQVASALEHMHTLDLAHRDVKPGNILFDNEGGANAPDMRIKLCDFGFATKMGGRMLRKLVGTPSYVAPELTGAGAEGGYRGRPVDMWALGVVVFEILHGKPTFYGANLEQLETRIRAVSHAPFDAFVSAGARALVSALLKADPAKRLSAKKTLEHGWLKQSALACTVGVERV